MSLISAAGEGIVVVNFDDHKHEDDLKTVLYMK